jgi:hypothetical protein
LVLHAARTKMTKQMEDDPGRCSAVPVVYTPRRVVNVYCGQKYCVLLSSIYHGTTL